MSMTFTLVHPHCSFGTRFMDVPMCLGLVAYSSVFGLLCICLGLYASLKKQVVFAPRVEGLKSLGFISKTADLCVTRVRPQGLSRGGVFRELLQVRPQNDNFAVFERFISNSGKVWRFAVCNAPKRQTFRVKTPDFSVVIAPKTPDFLAVIVHG